MKIIHCPINGPRPLQEFHFGGEVRTGPRTAEGTGIGAAEPSDEQWADYVFHRDGEPGVKREWWYHVPSGTWFIAERDNRTDEFLKTYLYGKAASDG